MARFARRRHSPVFMINGEAMRPIVSGGRPAVGVVTFDTILANSPLVRVIALMTGITSSESAFEYLVHMTGSTGHGYMFPG